MLRELGAELIGTFALVSAVCGAALFSAPSAGLMTVAFAIGFVVLAMAYAVGHISGGHFNPAVTCGLVAAGHFQAGKAIPYIIAQLVGGIAAAAFFYVVLSGVPAGKWNDFIAISNLYGDGHFSLLSVALIETMLTALFLIVIAGVITGNCPVGFAPLAIGLTLTVIHLVERIGKSGALDGDGNLWRRGCAVVPVAVLGRADPGRRDWRPDFALATERVIEQLGSGVWHRPDPLRRSPTRSGAEIDMATSGIAHRTIEANGIRLHTAEAGEGPLVVLCHGFPESWYSWRHQLAALSAAGYRVVAPDMRGYGQSDRPEPIDQYTLLHLVGDMVGLLDALGADQAVIAGHDWGAPVAWHAALLRPDRFGAVVGLSVPYRPRSRAAPTTVMPQRDDALFYQLYFQTPGVAEAELERDARETILKTLYSGSGDVPRPAPAGFAGAAAGGSVGMVPRDGGFLSRMPSPPALPAWLSEADIDFYAGEFARTGFRGGLNWYRNIDRNWELLAPFAGAKVTVPALYIVGDRDLVVAFQGADKAIAGMSYCVPQLRNTIMLPGCGHWTQQERAREVNAAMIDFLRQL